MNSVTISLTAVNCCQGIFLGLWYSSSEYFEFNWDFVTFAMLSLAYNSQVQE